MYYHGALLLQQKSVLCLPLSYDYLLFKRFPTTPYRCNVVLLNTKNHPFRIQLKDFCQLFTMIVYALFDFKMMKRCETKLIYIDHTSYLVTKKILVSCTIINDSMKAIFLFYLQRRNVRQNWSWTSQTGLKMKETKDRYTLSTTTCPFPGALPNFPEKAVCACPSCLTLITEIPWCWESVSEIPPTVPGDLRRWSVTLIVETMRPFLLPKTKTGLFLEHIPKTGVTTK